MVRILKDFRIDEISAVDEPAQKGARAVIMKSRSTPTAMRDELSITKAMAVVADPDEAVDLVETNIYGRAAEALMPGETIEKAYCRVLDALPDLYTAHDVAHRRRIAKRNHRPY